MLALVTGGTGFIGYHIARRLISSGHRVRCIVRGSSDTRAVEALGAELWYSDVKDRGLMREAMEGAGIVYHSAAMVGEWLSRRDARRTNVRGTGTLLECALEAGVKRFVYISSLAVLGMRHHHGTPDDAPYRYTGDIYSDSKIDAEQLVLRYYRENGLPAVIVRPGFVFGPGDRRFLPRMMRLLDEGRFKFVGGGRNIMNIVYIDNLVDAVMEAGKREAVVGHVYNIRNKDQVTMRGFACMIADMMGINHPEKSIPVPLAKLAAALMEFYGHITASAEAPFLTKARIKVSSLNLDFSIAKAQRELGYTSPVTIKEGLKRTIEAKT